MKGRGELIAGAEAMLGIEPEDLPGVDDRPCGWYVATAFSVRGVGHLCITCRPAQPTGMVAVFSAQLAAAELCKECGRRLDEVR